MELGLALSSYSSLNNTKEGSSTYLIFMNLCITDFEVTNKYISRDNANNTPEAHI